MPKMIVRRDFCRALLAAACLLWMQPCIGQDRHARPKPLFRDFMGLNVHTVQFRPPLYAPVTRLVRDYHPFNWDVGDQTDYALQFPFARNRVDWGSLYGEWRKAGYSIHDTVMFDDTPPAKWKDLPRDARTYGLAYARFFGPSGAQKLVDSVEIGNEPGGYDDASYRTLFENAARGMREGDPRLRISTCAVFARPSGAYHKDIATLKGLESLYDIINVHSYAQLEGYPTWRRSYPEDPRLGFLKDIRDVVAWRNANAPGKPVWLTEFGWDATTKPSPAEGDFKNWVGVTDTQQAQYLVRAFLVFSALDLDRAYIYFFNDDDSPSVHGSSGLTRHFQPKPSFHAVAHLYHTLGGYRFSRIVASKPNALNIYEFRQGLDPSKRVWAVWSPTDGTSGTRKIRLSLSAADIQRAERMPLAAGPPPPVRWTAVGHGQVEIEVGASPLYLWLRR